MQTNIFGSYKSSKVRKIHIITWYYLHHSPPKVNPPTKAKIKKEKRKIKNLITRTRTQVSPPPSQKPCHECSFPPRSKEICVNAARVLGLASLTINSFFLVLDETAQKMTEWCHSLTLHSFRADRRWLCPKPLARPHPARRFRVPYITPHADYCRSFQPTARWAQRIVS